MKDLELHQMELLEASKVDGSLGAQAGRLSHTTNIGNVFFLDALLMC